MVEVLQAPVAILEEGLGSTAGQGAGLQYDYVYNAYKMFFL